MIQVSTEVANALSQTSRQFDAKIYVNGSAVDCEIMSLKLHKGACGKFTVGSIFIPYVEMTVNGTTTLTTNTEFELKIAVKVNGSFGTYYRVGYFTPTSIENGRTQTEIYAQGRSANTNGVLFDTEPTQRSLNNILTAIRNKGFTVDLKGLTIPSASIDQLIPLIGLSVRDGLSLLASCSGGYVTEDSDGHIVLGKFAQSTPVVVNPDALSTYPTVKGEYELTGITVVVSESLKYDIPTAQAEKNFEIKNPYFNSDMVSTFTQNTIGFTFNVTEMPVSLGDFRFEPWDWLSFDNTPIPCLTLDFDFDGGLQTTVKAEGELPEEQAQKTAGPISAQLKEAYDKAIGANNLAQQASQDASDAYDMAESAYDGEGTSVSLTYKTQFAYGTTNAPVGAWQDTVPTLTTTYPYLWTKLVTIETTTTYNAETGQHTTTTRTIDQGSPSKSTLLDGVYTFINAAKNGTSTVIDGGSIMADTIYGNAINLSSAIYTGSHSTLISDNAGAYLGSDGIEYTSAASGITRSQYRITIFKEPSIYTTAPVIKVEDKTSGTGWIERASIAGNGDIKGNYISCNWIAASGTITGSNIPDGNLLTYDSLSIGEHYHTIGTVTSGNTISDSWTVSKSGYYPIGIVGWYFEGTNYSYLNNYRLRLTSKSSGSATIGFAYRNTGSSSATSVVLHVDVLWAKM